MTRQKRHINLIPPLEERSTFDQEAGGYTRPAIGKGPARNNGELPGYSPASSDIEAESLDQAAKLMARHKETSKPLHKLIKYGAVVVAAGGVLWGATQLAHEMGNQEKAPWAHHPAKMNK